VYPVKGLFMNFMHIVGIGLVLMVAGFSYGQDTSGVKISFNGHASAEAGQVVSGYDKNADNNTGAISHMFVDRIYLGAGFNVKFDSLTNFAGGVDVKTFNEFPRLVAYGATRRYYYYVYLTQAELTHKVIDKNGLALTVGGGYFPYKYNSNAMNLGEYMFRSTAYPQTLTTEFDFPFARLAGLYAKSAYTMGNNKLTFDFLATINTEWMAIGDLNLSMLASYNIAHAFEIGGGVEFGSVISADEDVTTPKNVSTKYTNVPLTDSNRYSSGIDSNNYYTFRGTKVMGRFSFDPKKIFPMPFCGDLDLILYGEAALLGVKNYPAALHSPIWYNSRLPVMLGFNVPTFKLLDRLSLEGEWWGNRYPNSLQGVVTNGLPLPFNGATTIDSTKYKNDNFKWSIYGCKSFNKHYKVTFQVANDHMRTFAWDWDRQDWEESLRSPKNWYYMLKFGVMF
jgi:hypothetical protein